MLKFLYATIAKHVRRRRSIRLISVTRCSLSNCYDTSAALRHSHLLPPPLQLRTSTAPIIRCCNFFLERFSAENANHTRLRMYTASSAFHQNRSL